jgi:replicative DNA helicase
MKKDHWLLQKMAALPEEEREEVVTQLLAKIEAEPTSTVEEMGLALVAEFTDEAKLRAKSFGSMQGIGTGYDKLDKLMLGLVPGELIIVAGKTSRGKTTLALNIANRVALNGHSVLFVTLEMTKVEIASRYIHINEDTPGNYDKVSALTVMQTRDELDWKSIDSLILKAREEMRVDLVVIDHLHYFTRELEHVSEDLGRITKEFKKNAIRHSVPVILISHVRKTGVKAEASMEDLRGSSYLAQDADIVLMVGRKENDADHLFVKIEKNRNRGFDYEQDTAVLSLDKIKIFNDELEMNRVTGVHGQPFDGEIPEEFNKAAPEESKEQTEQTVGAAPLF